MAKKQVQRLERIPAYFWQTDAGGEPALDFIKSLAREDMHAIGVDLATLQTGWPVGMPLCRPMSKGLHEMRSDLPSGVTARLLFCHFDGQLVILHGFIKKTGKTPKTDLDLARKRKATLE
jgi:phage-related protein